MRRELGIDGPTEIEIDQRDGAVEIRPIRREVTVGVADDGQPVLVAPEDTPPLTDEDVRRMIDESREWPRRY